MARGPARGNAHLMDCVDADGAFEARHLVARHSMRRAVSWTSRFEGSTVPIAPRPARSEMGVGHGVSADKPSLVTRRIAAACAGLAVALVVLITSIAFAVFDSDDEFPWFVLALVVGALMLLGVVFALLTIWRADAREPNNQR